jgi:hypothetical protein
MEEEAAMADREERIREIAHRLWEEAGRPSGLTAQHWEKAQQIVHAEDAEREALSANSAGWAGEGLVSDWPRSV